MSLGFGYESQSPDRPSVQTARAEFLNTIAETKPGVVFRLFGTCYSPFTELLELKKGIIAATCSEIDTNLPKENYILRQPKFIRERALERLLPNYHSLERIDGADRLSQELANWGVEHNLKDDWCLNDALEVLRTFDVADGKSLALMLLPDFHYLADVWNRSWQSAALERRLLGLHTRFQANSAVEARDALLFRFKYEELAFEVFGPFSKSLASFREEVQNEFTKVGGRNVRGARKHLDYELGGYLETVEKVRVELDLIAPPNWRKANDFFKWLVQYQLPPFKTYRQIAREEKKDDKTVSQGIQRVATLIGLTLRPNEADKHLGRPKGSKDKTPRRRANH